MEMQELNKKIKQTEKEILRKKANMLIEWTAFLYTSEHRCIMTVIAEKSFKENQLSISEIDKFRNGANLLKDLQEGLLVCMVYREQKNIEAKVNQHFFKLLPTLIQRIRAKIDPSIANLTKLNSNQEIKVCKICGVMRSQKEIQFIGESCNCSIPTFVPVEKDEAKLAKLTLIQGMLKRAQEGKNEIDKLNAEIARLEKSIDALNNRKLTEYQLFLQKHGLKEMPSSLRTPEMIAKAQRYYNSLNRLKSIQIMDKIRARRKQVQALKKLKKQPCQFTQMVKKQQQTKKEGKGETNFPRIKKDQENQKKEQGEPQENLKRVRRVDIPYYLSQRGYSYEPTSTPFEDPKQEPIDSNLLYKQALKEKQKRKQKYIKKMKQLGLLLQQLQKETQQERESLGEQQQKQQQKEQQQKEQGEKEPQKQQKQPEDKPEKNEEREEQVKQKKQAKNQRQEVRREQRKPRSCSI